MRRLFQLGPVDPLQPHLVLLRRAKDQPLDQLTDAIIGIFDVVNRISPYEVNPSHPISEATLDEIVGLLIE